MHEFNHVLDHTTKAYLYLSGTPFRALATGEFIEEQIFNWTYTDEQRAKAEFGSKHPGKWNPYGALPQMRLETRKARSVLPQTVPLKDAVSNWANVPRSFASARSRSPISWLR